MPRLTVVLTAPNAMYVYVVSHRALLTADWHRPASGGPCQPYATDDGREEGSESGVYHTALRHQKQPLRDVHIQQAALDSEYSGVP